MASFFVSRADGEVDKRLEEIGTDEALALWQGRGVDRRGPPAGGAAPTTRPTTSDRSFISRGQPPRPSAPDYRWRRPCRFVRIRRKTADLPVPTG